MKRHLIATVAILTLSLVINVGLAAKVRRLESTLHYIREGGKLQVGTLVDAVAVQSEGGTHAKLTFESTPLPTVIYVYSPTCGWCEKNLPGIKHLAKGIEGRVNVIGLSLDDKDLAPARTGRSVDRIDREEC
jgi:hypothetical protein